VPFDTSIATFLAALAVWILVSGFDDLFVSLVQVRTRERVFPWPSDEDLEILPERRLAIFVPLWHEHQVIGRMLDRNLASISYSNYDFFVGVYPNDELTIRAVTEVAARNPRVHLARCPHPGPTSKGDCLNHIYQAMLGFEARHGTRFHMVITHDAEDLVHPQSLRLINWFSRRAEMVQIPVLPLPTRFRELLHGLYCDEFAEYQSKDIPVRQKLGGFLPSNGVGAGFGREALERLAAQRDGQVFDPDCLTEDYENGLCLHKMGCRQVFVPVHFDGGGPIATREYFPRTLRSAVRQRSRWVAGICLQGWERHGWRLPLDQIYWLWRDRKGLVGNLLAPFTTIFLPWCAWYGFQLRESPVTGWLPQACAINLTITLVQTALRMRYSARIYGFWFALGVPLRMLLGNLVNFLATAEALRQFTVGKLRRRTLAWRKTSHSYPQHAQQVERRPRIGEVLVRMRCISMADLDEALQTCPPGKRLGEHLLELRKLTEEHVYEALSSQTGMPLGLPHGAPSLAAARSLPAEAARRWRVLPYRVSVGQLLVLTSEVPSQGLERELKTVSGLDIRFQLVRQSDFDALSRRYLPEQVLMSRRP
jgi:bacteriophage N4 adsorption protein B